MKLLYLNFEESRGPSVHIRGFISGFESLGNTVITNNPGVVAGNEEFHKKEVTVRPSPKTPVGKVRRLLGTYRHIFYLIWCELRAASEYMAVVRREKPDALLTRHRRNACGGYLLSMRTGIPLFFEVNSPLILEARRYGKPRMEWLMRWLNRRSFGRARAIVCVSEAVKRLMANEGAQLDKIHVVPNGTDVERFDPSVRDDSWIPEPHGPVIGFVGALNVWHGREVLEAMIPLVAREIPDARFLIVGGGDGVNALKSKMAEGGFAENLVCTDLIPHDRVPGAIGAMDIALAPYPKIDDFYFSPLKIFEYMAMAKPTIASAEGQIGELLEHGKTGWLVEPGDARAFADAIIHLSRDQALREEIGHAARMEVERNYTWQMNARRIQEVIEEHLDSTKTVGRPGVAG